MQWVTWNAKVGNYLTEVNWGILLVVDMGCAPLFLLVVADVLAPPLTINTITVTTTGSPDLLARNVTVWSITRCFFHYSHCDYQGISWLGEATSPQLSTQLSVV